MKKREFQKKAAAALLGKLADVVMELEENPNITITSEYHSSYFKLRKNYILMADFRILASSFAALITRAIVFCVTSSCICTSFFPFYCCSFRAEQAADVVNISCSLLSASGHRVQKF